MRTSEALFAVDVIVTVSQTSVARLMMINILTIMREIILMALLSCKNLTTNALLSSVVYVVSTHHYKGQ